MKAKTKQQHITEIRDAEVLYLPLCSNIGNPSKPLVKKGDTVLQYQLGLPETHDIAFGIALGYKNQSPEAPKRETEKVKFIR